MLFSSRAGQVSSEKDISLTGVAMIRTTVVGSWPLPEHYRNRLLQYHRGQLPDMLVKPTLSGAAEAAIREQQATGVTQFMGGEFFAEVFIQHIPRQLTGIRLVKPQADKLRTYKDVARYELTGEIDAPRGLGYVEAFRRESHIEPSLDKVAVPGPLEVLGHLKWTDTVRAQLPRAIEIVNRELRGLAVAKVREIQLDIPTVAIRSVLGRLAPEEAADLIARSFEGLIRSKPSTVAWAISVRSLPSPSIIFMRYCPILSDWPV